MAFCEALVTSNLVSDWDLSKVVCETFQLPFLPVDMITPNPAALEELDPELFRRFQVVPVDIFGQVLTVAMPALVPAEILAQISAMTDCTVLPLVGTVESNRRWCNDHLAPAPMANSEGGWESMFDAADAEVKAVVTGVEDDGLSIFDDPEILAADDDSEILDDDLTGALDFTGDELDLSAIEALPIDDFESDDADESATGDAIESDSDDPFALPPMPDFESDQRQAG